MEIPQPTPENKTQSTTAPESDGLAIPSTPDHEMTQKDWNPRAGSRAERAQLEAAKQRNRMQRPEFRRDQDDGRIGQPVIGSFAEAKAFKAWQDSQEPEAQAAAQAMQAERDQRAREQAEHLAQQAQQLANNPNAITGIPEHLKSDE